MAAAQVKPTINSISLYFSLVFLQISGNQAPVDLVLPPEDPSQRDQVDRPAKEEDQDPERSHGDGDVQSGQADPGEVRTRATAAATENSTGKIDENFSFSG